MHNKKDYIIVKDRHPRFSQVLNDCTSLCVPTNRNEPLSSVLQKICGKITSNYTTLNQRITNVQDEISNLEIPTYVIEEGENVTITGDGSPENPWVISSSSSSLPMRFGVVGEDDFAEDFRDIDLNENGIALNNGSFFSYKIQGENQTTISSSGGHMYFSILGVTSNTHIGLSLETDTGAILRNTDENGDGYYIQIVSDGIRLGPSGLSTFPSTSSLTGYNLLAWNQTTGIINSYTGSLQGVSFGTDNQIPFTNSTGNNFDYSSNLTFDGSNTVLTGQLDIISGAIGALNLGANNNGNIRSNNTMKAAKITMAHQVNAEEPFGLIFGSSGSGSNLLNLGGGIAGMNAATNIRGFVSANNTTLTGTEIFNFSLTELVLNDGGLNIDTRIEGDTDTNLIFVDASIDTVGIGTGTPVTSAKLQIDSTSKGFLLPRMTEAQKDAISSPVEGLLVYQTDNTKGLYIFDGTNWIIIS